MATYVANKRNTANITHIFWYDASVPAYSPNLMHAALPYNLLPVVPAVGDIVYFGINTAWVDSGPFCSLVFDIGTAQVDLTLTWEYSAAWAALAEQDNTNSFSDTGVNSVHWVQPAAWATAVVNGITGYWVRARVTGIGAAPSPPTQQNRDVYSIVWPYVEVQAEDVGGDVAAQVRTQIVKQDQSADTEEVLVGLRSCSRGLDFTPYLNIADEQNPTGITVAILGANSAFGNDYLAPSGRAVIYNPPGADAPQPRFSMLFSSSMAEQYVGKYQLFMRARQAGGTPGDMTFQAYIYIGTAYPGDIQIFVSESITASTALVPIHNLGTLEIDVPGAISGIFLFVVADNTPAGASGDLIFYDLILMPVDEWAGDFLQPPLGHEVDLGEYLDVDNVRFPKRGTVSYVRDVSDDAAITPYIGIKNGEAILQSNARQRVFFLTISEPHAAQPLARFSMAHSIVMTRNQRYLTMRGTR